MQAYRRARCDGSSSSSRITGETGMSCERDRAECDDSRRPRLPAARRRVRRPVGQYGRVSVSDEHLGQLNVILAVADAADRLQAVARTRQLVAVVQKVRLFTGKDRLEALHVCSKIITSLQ